MSLKIHYAVVRDTLAVLQTSDFTRTNVKYDGGGGTVVLGADFPDGQLGGQVAVHTGSFEVGVMSSADEFPIGLFINDAAGSPFENTPAVASGKSPFVSGSGSVVEVNIWEATDSGLLPTTTPPATTPPPAPLLGIPYTAGALLYGSGNGLVTTEVGTHVLGSVYRTPGTAGLLGVRIA